jgi:hypothetical protein
VLDWATVQGQDVHFHIAYFAVGAPDQDYGTAFTDMSVNWTMTILPNGIVQHRSDFSGCSGPSCPVAPPTAPIVLSLYQ